MIDLSKTYKTRSGLKVVLHKIVLKNSCGKNVTYPVKGTIYHNTKKNYGHQKTQYFIWSIDGIADIVWGNNRDLDLVEI